MSLRAQLRRLPKRTPPAGAWRRIEAELEQRDGAVATAAPTSQRSKPTLRYALAASLAAAMMFAAVMVLREAPRPETAAPIARTDSLAQLLAESARLERELVALPRHNGVIRVGTAGTIAGLEDQIAWLDAELSTSAAFDVDPRYQEALWRERVEVMNALVDVHYAQVPARVLRP